MQLSQAEHPDRRPGASRLRSDDCERLSGRLFTIGHSNHELPRFCELLRAAGVAAVADVRSSPYSQRLPQYNQSELRHALEAGGVAYLFFGHELGGRPRDRSVYDRDGRVDYRRVRATAQFREGLDRLIAELRQRSVALMCAEDDPLDCHRGLMIAPELVERGVCPRHVLRDGSLESTSDFEDRLLRETKVGAGMLGGLFAASITPAERAALLVEAYAAQARRRAFRFPAGESAGDDEIGE
jgi:hypothetical protein